MSDAREFADTPTEEWALPVEAVAAEPVTEAEPVTGDVPTPSTPVAGVDESPTPEPVTSDAVVVAGPGDVNVPDEDTPIWTDVIDANAPKSEAAEATPETEPTVSAEPEDSVPPVLTPVPSPVDDTVTEPATTDADADVCALVTEQTGATITIERSLLAGLLRFVLKHSD